MTTRTKEFVSEVNRHPNRHPFPQNGEGYCWPTLVSIVLNNRGSDRWTKELLIPHLKMSFPQGADWENVESFLNSRGLPTYEEQNCDRKRLKQFLTLPPDMVDLVACVMYKEVSPGYTPLTDPPEEHIVLLTGSKGMNLFLFNLGFVYYYDTSTGIGGLKRKSIRDWMSWWYGDDHERWLAVIGMGKDEVYSRIGHNRG